MSSDPATAKSSLMPAPPPLNALTGLPMPSPAAVNPAAVHAPPSLAALAPSTVHPPHAPFEDVTSPVQSRNTPAAAPSMLVPSPSVATAATAAVRPPPLLVATAARAGPSRPSPAVTSTPATAPSASCPPTSPAPAVGAAGRRLPTIVAAASAAGCPPRFPTSATAAAAAALPVGAPPSPATGAASLDSRLPRTLDAASAAAEAFSAAASPPPAAPSPTLAGASPVSISDALRPQGRGWVLMDGAVPLEKLAVVRGCARRVRASKACPRFNSQSAETMIALQDKAERGRRQVPVAGKGLLSKELRSCVDDVAARVGNALDVAHDGVFPPLLLTMPRAPAQLAHADTGVYEVEEDGGCGAFLLIAYFSFEEGTCIDVWPSTFASADGVVGFALPEPERVCIPVGSCLVARADLMHRGTGNTHGRNLQRCMHVNLAVHVNGEHPDYSAHTSLPREV